MKQNYTNDDTFLAKWLNDELTSEELTDFKNSEDYLLFQKIADKSTTYKIPEFNQDRVFENIKNKIGNSTKPKVRKLIPTWVYTTAAAVLLLLGLTFWMNQNTIYSSLKGQQLAYVLPDGSHVKLNGNSSVSFDKDDWKKGIRTLKLKGEGYFKVKKGSTFTVNTKEGSITVLGTQFNVQTVAKFLAVECYEGKVRVENKVFKTILIPGKGVKYSGDVNEKYDVNITEPNWLHKTYQYNGVPLKVVFLDIENTYNVTIMNKNVDVTQKYSGKLILNNLEKALTLICKPMNINSEIKGNVISIQN